MIMMYKRDICDTLIDKNLIRINTINLYVPEENFSVNT